MTRPIAALDVPLPDVEAAVRREMRAHAALMAVTARQLAEPDTDTPTTPEEGSK